eukprot:GEMP01020418.1.p1 GENE.GEMP01020418.1~~GEMP01020418.1.p1  ORF type:complete len:524 (+),score=131.43 GEMP01020418.1:169-1740(+)
MSVFFPPLSPLAPAAPIGDFLPSVDPSTRDSLRPDIIPPFKPEFSLRQASHVMPEPQHVDRGHTVHPSGPSAPSEADRGREMLAQMLKENPIPHGGRSLGAAASLAGKAASTGILATSAAMTAGAALSSVYGADALMAVPEALAKIPTIIPDFRVPPMPALPTGLGALAGAAGAKATGLAKATSMGISKMAWTGLLLLLKATSTLQAAELDWDAVKKTAKHMHAGVEKTASMLTNVEWADLENLLTKGSYSLAAMSFYRTIAKGNRWYDPELFFYLDGKRGYMRNTDLFEKYMDYHCWKYGQSVPYLEKVPKPKSHAHGVVAALEESLTKLLSSARRARFVHPKLSFDPAAFSNATLFDPPKVHVALKDANEPFQAPLWNATYALEWRPNIESISQLPVTAEKDPLPVRPGGDWYLPRHQAHVFSTDTPFHLVCPPPNDVPHAFRLEVTEEASERPISSLEFHAYHRASDPAMPAPLDFLGVAGKLNRMGGSALSLVTGANDAALHGFHELKDQLAHPMISHF